VNQDIRWVQRFSNFSKALLQLGHAVDLAGERELSDLEKQGLVQAFEFTHELAWKVIKDFYEDQGTTGLQGSRDAVRLAFQRGLIESGDIWMDMIGSRNKTSHIYDEDTMEAVLHDICSSYYAEFKTIHTKFETLSHG